MPRQSDDVRARIDILDVGQGSEATDAGDLACWASLVCPGCGGVTTDPGHDLQHRRWLAAVDREPAGDERAGPSRRVRPCS
jgi:hypothetical protein